jgi:hypothetical protein
MFDQDLNGAAPPARAGAGLHVAVDVLAGLSLGTAGDDALLDMLRDMEAAKARLAALDAAIVAEVHARGLAGQRACASTAALLTQVLRLHPRDAASRVRAAANLGPRRALTGQPREPVFPTVAQAMSAGQISGRHATVIVRTVDALPCAVQAEHDRSVETFLVSEARRCNPAQLALLARRISDTLDPDGTLTDIEDRKRRRHLTVIQRPDGSAHLEAELAPLCAEALLTVLDTLARPKPARPGDADGASVTEHECTRGAGDADGDGDGDGASDTEHECTGIAGDGDSASGVPQPDSRTAAQRRHDALHDAMLTLLRSDELPACGGITTTILLTITDEDLRRGRGVATTGHGALIPTSEALRLAGDAQLIPVLLARTKRIEAYGHTQRLFTPGQRLAMISRDQGCSFPGCTVPPAWCQAHHIIDWADGGPTTIDNGTLLCGYHHREHPTLGWSCAMSDGIPHWTAPSWLDPTHTPQRNHAHDTTADVICADVTAADIVAADVAAVDVSSDYVSSAGVSSLDVIASRCTPATNGRDPALV